MPHGPVPHGGPPHGAHGPRTAAPPNGAPERGPRTAVCRMAPLPIAPLRTELRTGDPEGRSYAERRAIQWRAGTYRQYRLPNGRRVPPNADRLYRPPGPSAPGGTSGRHHGTGPAAPTRTPTAGAARRRHRAHRRQARHCQAARGLEHRPQVRLTGVRSPIAPRGQPGYLGNLGYLGLPVAGAPARAGRASMVLTAASGSGRHWGCHPGRHGDRRRGHHRNRRDR